VTVAKEELNFKKEKNILFILPPQELRFLKKLDEITDFLAAAKLPDN
jgi:hypothetical protein